MIVVAQTPSLGKHLVAEQKIKKGTAFYKIETYQILDRPTYQSVQISANKHLLDNTVIYLNHSCDPNIIINVDEMKLYALRDIEKGEALYFFYPSTDWDLDCPFNCFCNSKQCLKVIKGAKYLSDTLLNQYFINPHIYQQKRDIYQQKPETKTLL